MSLGKKLLVPAIEAAYLPTTEPAMTRTITHRKKEIEVGEDTPLTISGLAQFFGWSRNLVHADVNRGYDLEYGTSATPKHYRAWLRAHPRPQRAQAETSRLERELSKLN